MRWPSPPALSFWLLFPSTALILNIDACLDADGQWSREPGACEGVDAAYDPLSQRRAPLLFASLADQTFGGVIGFAASKLVARVMAVDPTSTRERSTAKGHE